MKQIQNNLIVKNRKVKKQKQINLKTVNILEKNHIRIDMDIPMLGNGKTENIMDKELSHGKMEASMLGNLKMVNFMDKER